jgi:hypothetical protein
MEIIAFWVILALVVGYGATRKGRSGVGWFLLSVLVSPLIAGILLIIVGQSSTRVVAPRPDHVATLTSLADLHDRGILSDEEYEAKRTEVLARV